MNKTRVHFIGIGGSGISGVARLAKDMGYLVTGCDIEGGTDYLDDISIGHNKDHVKSADFIVASPAVLYYDEENEEVAAAKRDGKFMLWQEFVGKHLAKSKEVICIAGTHGKSTTTAMTGKLLEDAGLDPLVVLGAKVPEWTGNSRFGNGKYFVVEADEFNDNFLNYSPEIIVINNIEFDHPDYFKNEEEVFNSFKKFIGKLTGRKLLIVNWDDVGIRRLINERTDGGYLNGITLVKVIPSDFFDKVNLKIPGKHNLANAAMAFALGEALGLKDSEIKASLANFNGIGRRLEYLGRRSGIKFYDDYAHHPTAVTATLKALRELYPASKIWSVYEPHGYLRTKALLMNYKDAFGFADKVLIGPIYAARDKVITSLTPKTVADATGHTDAKGYDSFEEIKKDLREGLKTGDVVLVMGAGKSYIWSREIQNLVPMKFGDLTTFGVGGSIRKYFEVKSAEEIMEAVMYAKNEKLPIFIMGGGSDILVSDNDFDGVVIKYTGESVSIDGETVTAEAGMEWDKLVEITVGKNLQGIECLSGIPGSVGASPIQNIGAYGQELKNVFDFLLAFDIENEKLVRFDSKDCDFGYRESAFKKKENWQKYIITQVVLKLKKNGDPDVLYDSLRNYLNERAISKPSLRDVREAVLIIRSGKFENPKKVGNAGSFFKNPVVDARNAEELKKKYPEIPLRDQENGTFKTSAGWFIEKAGWKGKTYKTAGVSPKHALVLINPEGTASASDVLELSEKIISDVSEKFGIKLEREVQLINF